MFYTKPDSLMKKNRNEDTSVVLGIFSTVSSTNGTGYEKCVCHHGSETRNTNSIFSLSFVRSRKFRSVVFWFQNSDLDQ